MLERTDRARLDLRPASLVEALRERTRDLHVRAEQSGIIADILKGRCTRESYARLLRSLLPVYQALERQLTMCAGSSAVAPIVFRELERSEPIAADLHRFPPGPEEISPAVVRYVTAIIAASEGDGSRLIAHAYARYLGDLSGGQILSRLLARSLDLPPEALSFYAFPAISNVAAFKSDYRAAIDRAGDESEDFDAVVEEGARAFELNIELSLALQADVARSGS